MDVIDLRSDTVTRPTAAMRAAMLDAEVGDDVYGEDPTVNALQERLADELGFDAGLFVPSGTQSNLLALLAHCERGDEYLVGMDAHTYKFEGGGAAVLGSIQPQPIVQADDGSLPLEGIAAAIKPAGPALRAHPPAGAGEHVARAHAAAGLPAQRARPARTHGLGMHLDGARLFNAAGPAGAAARDHPPLRSVSVCRPRAWPMTARHCRQVSRRRLGAARRRPTACAGEQHRQGQG